MSGHDLRASLCLVTDRGFRPFREFLGTIEAAIAAGVTMVQFREKASHRGQPALSDRESYRLGCQIRNLTRATGTLLVVDDRLDLAMAIDADGVHLGQTDLPLALARKLWGETKLYGLSVASIPEAQAALAEGADYLGVGAVFPTATKTDGPSADLDCLAGIVKASRLPVIAIGGIGVNNVTAVMQTGCAGIAVVSAIWGAANPAAAAEKLAAMVQLG